MESIKKKVEEDAAALVAEYCDGTYLGLDEKSKPMFGLSESSVIVDEINPFELRDRIVDLVMKYAQKGNSNS